MTTSFTEEALRGALDIGMLTPDEFNLKLATLRGHGTNLELPAKTYSSSLGTTFTRTDFKKQGWCVAAGPFQTQKEARASISKVEHGGNNGCWRWADSPGKPGDCRRVCNYHTDCQVHLREYFAGPDDGWYLYVTSGIDHGIELKKRKRSNSGLLLCEEAAVLTAVEHGKTPNWTMKKVGIDKVASGGQKNSDGSAGVEGAKCNGLSRQLTSRHDVYPLLIHVRY